MDNPEKLAILGIQDLGRVPIQTKRKQINKDKQNNKQNKTTTENNTIQNNNRKQHDTKQQQKTTRYNTTQKAKKIGIVLFYYCLLLRELFSYSVVW